LEIEGEFAFSLEQVALGNNKRGKPVTSCVVVEADTPEHETRTGKLTDMERGFLKEIRELINRGEHIELVEPERGMPVLRTVTRAVLRSWLIQRGKLAVTDDVTVTVTLSGAEKQRLYRVLNSLNDKGFIGMNAERVWLLG
jgi:hypothetical protein